MAPPSQELATRYRPRVVGLPRRRLEIRSRRPPRVARPRVPVARMGVGRVRRHQRPREPRAAKSAGRRGAPCPAPVRVMARRLVSLSFRACRLVRRAPVTRLADLAHGCRSHDRGRLRSRSPRIGGRGAAERFHMAARPHATARVVRFRRRASRRPSEKKKKIGQNILRFGRRTSVRDAAWWFVMGGGNLHMLVGMTTTSNL